LEIKIAYLLHLFAPVNFLSSPKVLRSAPVHTTKTTFVERHVSCWTERDARPRHI